MIQTQLVKYFDGDPMCVNESRVMRLPGFMHCKKDTPVEVTCASFHPERKYTQDQLSDVLPEVDLVPVERKSGTEKGIDHVICSKSSFAMISDNPHAGFYEAETSRTLDQGGGNPTCNQGGIAVVEGEKTYAVTTGSYTQVTEEQAPTLMARDFKDPAAVNRGYSVRRLTPTECARLQGFPDWWCADLDTPEPTEADIAFWTEVWETHRKIMGTSSKPKSRNQIVKWLRHSHSDAAEYKMWGNGVALPCVFFVLAGIVWSTQLNGG